MRLPANEPIPLWSGKVPYSLGDAPEDNPSITVYYPRDWRNTGKAVVILPGGGYSHLADHEGSMYAKWLASHGYTAIVCYYRVSSDARPYRHPAMISDAARAIRLVRANAADMGIQPDKIGLMGSSAGGHLAASTATFHELGYREEGESQEKDFGRPDFTILCYPVISMGPLGHKGSMEHLLGVNPPAELVEQLSMEKSADAHTPHAFIWHTWSDAGVPVQNSLYYAARLKEMGVRCDLHVYEREGHGMGLGDYMFDTESKHHPWTEECLRWLAQV